MDDKYADPNRPENTYSVAFGEEPNQSPSFLYVNKANGNIYDKDGNLVQQASVGSEQKLLIIILLLKITHNKVFKITNKQKLIKLTLMHNHNKLKLQQKLYL